MPRLTPDSPPERRAPVVVRRLRAAYPDARISLDFGDGWQLLVAVILSAQCTDARVNEVTPRLFARFPAPADVLQGTQAELEDLIRPTGFFRNKARSIRGAAAYLTEHHDGRLPRTTAELVLVPGVGRKTAAVVLGEAYGIAEGIAVDTHVRRISGLLGLTTETEPTRIERDLVRVVPRRAWILWTHLLIAHGRAICKARTPMCAACVLADICPTGRDRLRASRRAAAAVRRRARASRRGP
jgi:endonuclease-3